MFQKDYAADYVGGVTTPKRKRGRGADPQLMKATLISAATTTLMEDGFRGATARAIAERADCNQAAIYYHFGGIDQLLLVALEQGSTARLARYQATITDLHDLPALVKQLHELHVEDVESGHMAVLTELVGGITAKPELRAGIESATEPWLAFIEHQIGEAAASFSFAAYVPAEDLADLVFSLVVGIELRNKLDGQTDRGDRLFRLAGLLANMAPKPS